ncbi:MAG TPA: DUF1848 domain-containing protein [Alphaproteobacteria bacterium]|nr:DUF1848 domain-containing protein [Alphaproteobacteria bacterium]
MLAVQAPRMIISASYKTDIPAFYGDWLMARLDAGYCHVVNPYGRQVHRVDLRPEAVDGFVFWTRNLALFMAPLAEIERRGFPFIVQFTLTGYPRALEAATVAAGRAVGQIRAVAADYGPRAAVWRYDPILVSSLTPLDWHRVHFARLADALAGAVDEVVVSFAQIYRKTGRNLAAAARRHGFDWRDPEPAEKRALLADLARIAAARGMRLTLCTQPELVMDGIGAARCVDAQRLSDVAGHPIAARQKGNRPGCLCAQSRDIGDYDSCTQGCVYCYAVSSRALAQRRRRAHDPASEMLIPAGRGVDPDGRVPPPPQPSSVEGEGESAAALSLPSPLAGEGQGGG